MKADERNVWIMLKKKFVREKCLFRIETFLELYIIWWNNVKLQYCMMNKQMRKGKTDKNRNTQQILHHTIENIPTNKMKTTKHKS